MRGAFRARAVLRILRCSRPRAHLDCSLPVGCTAVPQVDSEALKAVAEENDWFACPVVHEPDVTVDWVAPVVRDRDGAFLKDSGHRD